MSNVKEIDFQQFKREFKDFTTLVEDFIKNQPTPPPVDVAEFEQRTRLSRTIFYKLWNNETIKRHYLEGTERRFLERKSFENWLKGRTIFHNIKSTNNSTGELKVD